MLPTDVLHAIRQSVCHPRNLILDSIRVQSLPQLSLFQQISGTHFDIANFILKMMYNLRYFIMRAITNGYR